MVELLLVVAIVAAIGSGVVVHYGREIIANARHQMTLREMAEIKRAFLSFYNDNAPTIAAGVCLPGTDLHLPTADFCTTFHGSTRIPSPWSRERPNRFYAAMEFFERFGLWPLLRPNVTCPNKDDQICENFINFTSDPAASGIGWQGPYLSNFRPVTYDFSLNDMYSSWTNGAHVVNIAETVATMPQIALSQVPGGQDYYRIVYFEHCRDESNEREPIYRRLLLLGYSRSGAVPSNVRAVEAFTGNRRRGSAYPINELTGVIEPEDQEHGRFFLELANFDINER